MKIPVEILKSVEDTFNNPELIQLLRDKKEPVEKVVKACLATQDSEVVVYVIMTLLTHLALRDASVIKKCVNSPQFLQNALQNEISYLGANHKEEKED